MTPLGDLADFVALVYHEARNVRHLIRAKAIGETKWKYLIVLPTNRTDAWATLQDVRAAARSETEVLNLLGRFQERFRVDLGELEELYGNSAWRSSSCGGNAWLAITQSVRRLAESIGQGNDAEAVKTRRLLEGARHNTGTVAEKLRRLDEALSERHKRSVCNRKDR